MSLLGAIPKEAGTAAPVVGMRVAIVGGGLVSPLGDNAHSTWDALLAGRCIDDHSRAAGDWDPAEPRVIAMARRAADEALSEAGWDWDDEFALVVGTSKGSVEQWLDPSIGPNVTGLADVAAALPARGSRLTVSAACASGLVALARATMMIRARQARRVLVVASEASVHPLFLGSFARLGVLARRGERCRPFDAHRSGFLMSEAAAAVCLKGREHSCGSPGDGECNRDGELVIDGIALGGDATHLTAGDSDARLLRYLLRKVLADERVDLAHAHGTGTKLSDPIELASIDGVLRDRVQRDAAPSPLVYSHKGALGHSLGAAGLVSVVLTRWMHRWGTVPPMPNLTQPLPTQVVRLCATGQRQASIERSVILASGFGGATAVVSLASSCT